MGKLDFTKNPSVSEKDREPQIDLSLLERNVKALEPEIREIRRTLVDIIPELVTDAGRKLHPLTRRKLLSTRDLTAFFNELGKHMDLEEVLEEDARKLKRYIMLKTELVNLRKIVRREVLHVEEKASKAATHVLAEVIPFDQSPATPAEVISQEPQNDVADIAPEIIGSHRDATSRQIVTAMPLIGLRFRRSRLKNRPLTELTTRNFRDRLKPVMRCLKSSLFHLGDPALETTLKQITDIVLFFRTLEAHGINLQKAIGERHVAELEAYEQRKTEAELHREKLEADRQRFREEKESRRRQKKEARPARMQERDGEQRGFIQPTDLDRMIDGFALEDEKVEMSDSESGRIGPYAEFLRFHKRVSFIPPLTPQQEYAYFEQYEDGKRNIIDALSFERRSMRTILAICIPRNLYCNVSRKSKINYGFQFFTSYSPDLEPIDAFALIHGEGERVDSVLQRCLEAKIEDGDSEDREDDEIIDFGLNYHEICLFIRQHGILYLREFRSIKDTLDQFRFRPETVQRKRKDHYEGKEDLIGNAVKIFVESPASKTLLQCIEYLWAETSRAETSQETLECLLERFFEELQKVGVTIPRNIAKIIAAKLAAADIPRRSIVDLFMKIRPSPDLIKALIHFSLQGEALKLKVDELFRIKQAILNPHLRNVCFSARFFVRRGARHDVCIESGTLGLMRAADVFDYRRGLRFYKYCWGHVYQAIKRGLFVENDQIDIPVFQHERMEQVKRASRVSVLRFGDELTEHIAEIAEMTEDAVEEAMKYIRLSRHQSYETADSDDEGPVPPKDSLATATTETPEDILLSGELLRADLVNILGKAGLTSRERTVVERRYLYPDGETLEQIGIEYGLTRERIRQIEHNALRKLQRYMRSKGLTAKSFLP